LRNFLFRMLYWLTSTITGLVALPLLAVPGRQLLMMWLKLYAKVMLFHLRMIAGVNVKSIGNGNIPKGGCIIAAKHQSWGDGYTIFSQISDLAIVTGDHLEKIPFVGFILQKMQAIVVNQCGGAQARNRLMDEDLVRARTAKRKILIYPEGRLGDPGYHFAYKKGIFHMYEAYQCPVVPVATNLGLFWPRATWNLKPGEATIQFLEPIQPGLDKDTFMALLEECIETASLALLPKGFQVPENRLLVYDDKRKRGVPVEVSDTSRMTGNAAMKT